MALGRTAIKGGVAALMVMAMTAGAFAWEAFATTSLNVRSGPGTNYRVVDVLQRNEVVDVEYCRSGWCFINTGGRYGSTGWASENYLQPARYAPRPQPQPPIVQPPRPNPQPPYWRPGQRPPVWYPSRPDNFDARFCYRGDNGYFCFGT